MRPTTTILAALAPFALACSTFATAPAVTAFVLQGRLTDAGQPMNGPCDLEFRLMDAAAGGAQVGPTLCVDGVAVSDGLFTVQLDFGDQFDGTKRFVQVSVAPDGTAGNCGQAPLTAISPRLPIAPEPHAMHALETAQWRTEGTAVVNANSGFVGVNRSTPVTASEYFGLQAPVQSGYGGMYVRTEG